MRMPPPPPFSESCRRAAIAPQRAAAFYALPRARRRARAPFMSRRSFVYSDARAARFEDDARTRARARASALRSADEPSAPPENLRAHARAF